MSTECGLLQPARSAFKNALQRFTFVKSALRGLSPKPSKMTVEL